MFEPKQSLKAWAEKIAKEIQEGSAKLAKAATIATKYPDLQIVFPDAPSIAGFSTALVNYGVDDCRLVFWEGYYAIPFLREGDVEVYSSPCFFKYRDEDGDDRDWKAEMRSAGIPERCIDRAEEKIRAERETEEKDLASLDLTSIPRPQL